MSKKIFKAPAQILKSPIRTIAAVGTGGLSEVNRRLPVVGDPIRKIERAGDNWLAGNGGDKGPITLNAPQNPAEMLAATGGAALLTNVALGANIEQAIAGYFGYSDWNDFATRINDKDYEAVIGVRNQLYQIQSQTNLRNQAVQKVIDDFPNVVETSRKQAGIEFDETTKNYLDQALQRNASKYAAGGQISSGAANEAAASIGADLGLQKLGYMDERGQIAQDRAIQQFQTRLAETQALRDFQNTMLGAGAGQGFSAMQASLNRNQQTNQFNAEAQNQQNLMDQQSKNALFGSLGGLAGSIIGGSLFGPAGAAAGGSLFGATRPNPNSGFATLRSQGQASRAPGGVQQYRPFGGY